MQQLSTRLRYMCALLMLLGQSYGQSSRAFTNPLNSKSVDVFFVIDETTQFMNPLEHDAMKAALYKIAVDLNPSGSSPYFGVFFYGAASYANMFISFPTTSAGTFKTQLDSKRYTGTQAPVSTLSSALLLINSQCSWNCRAGRPRVTVIFSSDPDASAEITIRQLEKNHGMTVIVVGIGNNINTTVLARLASQPSSIYANLIRDYFTTGALTTQISDQISNVPRVLSVQSLEYVGPVANRVYHTVQINTASHIETRDKIVMFGSGCSSCMVYGSVSEPIPTDMNTPPNNDRRVVNTCNNGYPNTLTFFRVPQNTTKLYVSLLGNGMSGIYITCDVFSLPEHTTTPHSTFSINNLGQTIG